MITDDICTCEDPQAIERWTSPALDGGWWTKCATCGGFIEWASEAHRTWSHEVDRANTGATRGMLIERDGVKGYEQVVLV